MTAAAALVKHLIATEQVLATAESCTGGMIAAAITDIPGSSEIFEEGLVTYSNKSKKKFLGVDQKTLDNHGAVSEEVAREMAVNARLQAAADIGVSVSGIAGPGGSEFKPEGRVCFAIATRAGVFSETIEFGAIGRANVRVAARDHALTLIAQASGLSP
ncbi:MAG: CinA family protein [Dinoroseobacter sp.]|nr:CinA family protein [Dinoroseobacter sp.]